MLAPNHPDRYPGGYAIVTAAYDVATDRAEHYVAEGLTRMHAELIVHAVDDALRRS